LSREPPEEFRPSKCATSRCAPANSANETGRIDFMVGRSCAVARNCLSARRNPRGARATRRRTGETAQRAESSGATAEAGCARARRMIPPPAQVLDDPSRHRRQRRYWTTHPGTAASAGTGRPIPAPPPARTHREDLVGTRPITCLTRQHRFPSSACLEIDTFSLSPRHPACLTATTAFPRARQDAMGVGDERR
jgi:hypothetical protein